MAEVLKGGLEVGLSALVLVVGPAAFLEADLMELLGEDPSAPMEEQGGLDLSSLNVVLGVDPASLEEDQEAEVDLFALWGVLGVGQVGLL